MGFYTRRYTEAVINGEDQEENPGRGDYTEDNDNPTNPETPPAEGEPTEPEDPEPNDYTADDSTGEPPSQGEEPTVEPEEGPGEADETDGDTPVDYTIPDDAEPATAEGEPTEPEEGPGEANDYTADDNETDSVGDEPTEGETGDTGEGDTDYTSDGEDDGEANNGEESGSGEEETSGEANSSAGAINNDLKAKENELFADLTDEQKVIRDIELKGLYAVLYDSVDDIINRINNIHKTEYTLDVFEFISTKLTELKTLIHYNLTVTFSTKSYIENQITYQECLAVLNTVEEMLKTVEKSSNSNENS